MAQWQQTVVATVWLWGYLCAHAFWYEAFLLTSMFSGRAAASFKTLFHSHRQALSTGSNLPQRNVKCITHFERQTESRERITASEGGHIG